MRLSKRENKNKSTIRCHAYLTLSITIHWPAVSVITKSKHWTSSFVVNRSLNIINKVLRDSISYFAILSPLIAKHSYRTQKKVPYNILKIR